MRPDSRRKLQLVLAAIYYFALICFVLRPASPWDQNSLPIKQKNLQVVAMFNAWTIWWNAESLTTAKANYWQAPIFHPDEFSLAYSEPQPATLMVAPILWAGNSPARAYLVYLYASLFLNAFVTLLLVQARSRSVFVGFVAGAFVLMLPLVHASLDVLQLVPIWAIVWTWISASKLLRQPSLKRGLITGFAFGCVCLISLHQALMMTVLLGFTGWLLFTKQFSWRLVSSSLVAVSFATVIVFPLASTIQKAVKQHEFERNPDLVQKLSALPSSYLNLPGNPLIHADPDARLPREHLCVGWIKMLLGFFAICVMVKRRKWDRWILFLAFTCLMAFCLSLGPHLQIGTWQPWQLMARLIPGVAQVRSAYRYAYFVQLSVVLLAVEGVRVLFVWNRHPMRSTRQRRLTSTVLLSLVMASVLETYPSAPTLAGVPSAGQERPWVTFLKEQTQDEHAIACFPFATGNGLAEYDTTALWMYYGTMHGKPMVNGYSGFFPKSYFSLRDLVNEQFPSITVIEELRERDVEYLVVLRSSYSVSEIMSDSKLASAVELVVEDPAGIDIYRLKPSR